MLNNIEYVLWERDNELMADDTYETDEPYSDDFGDLIDIAFDEVR